LGGLKGEVDAANRGCFAVRGLLAKYKIQGRTELPAIGDVSSELLEAFT
jgi:hypothetical protein